MAENPQPELDTRHVTASLSWEDFSGRDDPRQRYRVYRLCDCDACEKGWIVGNVTDEEYERGARSGRVRCVVCRGEGKIRELIATAETPEALGVAIVTLGREGEFLDAAGNPCALGVLDVQGAVNEKWLVRPWMASPRNLSDAGRVLGTARGRR